MALDLSSKRISRSVIATITQVLVSGLVFFVLYRYLYDRLGVEQIGVWSLVLAATSVSRIAELGLSAGVVRFVAQALSRGEHERAADVVQTTGLTLAVSMALLLLAGYPLTAHALSYFLPAHGLAIALEILPYAVFSLWLMILVSVVSGGLDGCMRMDLRSISTAISHLAYLVLALFLVPQYGLKGVAVAQIIQLGGLVLLLWWLLRKHLSALPLMPCRWRYSVLKEIMGYGVNFQIISLMNMVFDPLVKALMSKFGGLDALGYYEMANRLILQGRAIIVEASRVMVPAIAGLQEQSAEKAKALFSYTYELTFYVAVLFFGVLAVLLPAISILWLGHYQIVFVQFSLLLTISWFVNTLVGPAYFSNLGTGNLRDNMHSHVTMLLVGTLVSVGLGTVFGGLGVVMGTAMGLIAGSLLLLARYAARMQLRWLPLLVPAHMVLLSLTAILAGGLAYLMADVRSSTLLSVGTSLVLSAVILAHGFIHPLRKRLARSVV